MTPHGRPPAVSGPGADRPDLLAGLIGLVERALDMVIVVDARGTITWANAATEKILGYDRRRRSGPRSSISSTRSTVPAPPSGSTT